MTIELFNCPKSEKIPRINIRDEGDVWKCSNKRWHLRNLLTVSGQRKIVVSIFSKWGAPMALYVLMRNCQLKDTSTMREILTRNTLISVRNKSDHTTWMLPRARKIGTRVHSRMENWKIEANHALGSMDELFSQRANRLMRLPGLVFPGIQYIHADKWTLCESKREESAVIKVAILRISWERCCMRTLPTVWFNLDTFLYSSHLRFYFADKYIKPEIIYIENVSFLYVFANAYVITNE